MELVPKGLSEKADIQKVVHSNRCTVAGAQRPLSGKFIILYQQFLPQKLGGAQLLALQAGRPKRTKQSQCLIPS